MKNRKKQALLWRSNPGCLHQLYLAHFDMCLRPLGCPGCQYFHSFNRPYSEQKDAVLQLSMINSYRKTTVNQNPTSHFKAFIRSLIIILKNESNVAAYRILLLTSVAHRTRSAWPPHCYSAHDGRGQPPIDYTAHDGRGQPSTRYTTT